MSELEKRLNALELYVSKKNRGALTTYVSGPFSRMAHVSAHVYWDGEKVERDFPSPWAERDKGFVGMSHVPFGMVSLLPRSEHMNLKS